MNVTELVMGGDAALFMSGMNAHLLDFLASGYNYWMAVVLMMIGFYITLTRSNLVKKIIGLNLFQTAMFLLYISIGNVANGTVPILTDKPGALYSNPLPHVLILTAIVVGIATTALGLALAVRIHEAYGTIEEDEILDAEAGDS
ncbi:MAG: cation:proton antiporter subunit C [Hyphomicrobiales bacterium]|nr:cation:proton antiporter subunit C [Hyphomicrobiales bacterium]MCY4049587.1 cation:proton antiporter subunit C [Hyphomicrobiales bacterium]MCY4053397.1 cation:proton antiporter subunit C [Hyphomicrobiales bacterium]